MPIEGGGTVTVAQNSLVAGRYRVVGQLGAGGAGSVMVATEAWRRCIARGANELSRELRRLVTEATADP